MHFRIPTIRTARLMLIPPEAAHLDDRFALYGDATTILRYDFEQIGAQRIAANIAPENLGSLAVAHKLGMVLDLTASDQDWQVF